ncbi:MAG: hypothetical protein KA586_03125 [Candidatus Promineofilum sp.]|nr:hypothetical protein [Promineifilum sp.]
MSSHTNGTQSPISPDLFEILRDPQAIQEGGHGADPGRLQLVRGAWLVSADTGYKYPIRDGIPVMLVEEGARWKDTPVDALPVPPPAAEPVAETRATGATPSPSPAMPDYRLLLAVGAILLFLLAVLTLGRRRSAGRQSLPPAT